VEVEGKRIEVSLPTSIVPGAGGAGRSLAPAPKRRGGSGTVSSATGDAVASPMQATIVKLAVEDGQQVVKGDLVVVLEAMKMEQPITAHKDGTVSGLQAEVGQTVTAGAVLCEITD
jgi:acetyl-CoA/propionyl-CoA carboxylase biotin carboxyl carrier protein